CPQYLEQISRRHLCWDLDWLIGAGKVEPDVAKGCHLFKGSGLVTPLEEVGRPHDVVFGGTGPIVLPHDRKPTCMPVGQTSQEHCVNDREDRGVGSNA